MTHTRLILVACLCTLFALPARAHPHIFVDAEIAVIFDEDGTPKGVEIAWVYDEFFSMLLVSDMGLDPDFTGEVTDEEREELDGFDMNWIEDYHGDTHVTQGGDTVALTGPVEWSSDFRDGQLRSRHLRLFPDPPDPAHEFIVAVYDPTYYTSYGIVGQPELRGREDCTARIFEPDWDAAESRLQDALDELLGAGQDIEANFPAVGELFSEEVRLVCDER